MIYRPLDGVRWRVAGDGDYLGTPGGKVQAKLNPSNDGTKHLEYENTFHWIHAGIRATDRMKGGTGES